jgi:hypothetical protein
MEPLKPEFKAQILERIPNASPAEIDEYERLLSERFSRDPSERRAAPDGLLREQGQSRLQELYNKLIVPLERR